jgi:hypothetical protein
VEGAYKPFQNLLTNLQSGAQSTDKTISQEQSDAASASQAANKAIADQQNALNTSVNTELSNAQQNAVKQNAAVANELKNIYGGAPINTTPTTLGTYGGGSTPWVNTTNYNVNALTPQTASALGMTPDQATALQAALKQAATSTMANGHNFAAPSGTTQLDLSQFLTQVDPTQAITAANVATPEQYAQEQAFQTLLNSLPTGAVLNPNTASSAGTAPTNFNTFDYNTALQNAQQTAAAEQAAAQQEAAGLTSAADLAHAQSQHGGGFLNALKNAVTNPINTVASVANPVSWIPNAINLAQGKNVSPTNMGQQYIHPAHGGVVEKKEEYMPFKNLVSKIPTGVK